MLSFCDCDDQAQEDGSGTFPSYQQIYGVIACIVGTVVGWYFYQKLKYEGYIDEYYEKFVNNFGGPPRNYEEVGVDTVNVRYQDSNCQTAQVQQQPRVQGQQGLDNRVQGQDNRVQGHDNRVQGHDNRVQGHDNRGHGHDNQADHSSRNDNSSRTRRRRYYN